MTGLIEDRLCPATARSKLKHLRGPGESYSDVIMLSWRWSDDPLALFKKTGLSFCVSVR
jgi:hypothetical protein